jgi:PTH1 family peptidyl-tRNA hydrolase
VIRLVVGLGHPGQEYERTRHNAGFWLVERFAQATGVVLRKDPKFKALVGKNAAGAWLLLPQSFMNLSGQPVQMLAGFFRIKPEEVLVVHDELDFAPGVARIKQGGGIAGHNGLRDISQRLGSHEYWRLRVGVGKPPAGTEGGDYVLHKPAAGEKALIDQAIERSLQVFPEMLKGDMQAAIQKLHSGEPKPVEKKEPPVKEPEPQKAAEPKKAGLLGSLFGKK